jgi:hypothetical protein
MCEIVIHDKNSVLGLVPGISTAVSVFLHTKSITDGWRLVSRGTNHVTSGLELSVLLITSGEGKRT